MYLYLKKFLVLSIVMLVSIINVFVHAEPSPSERKQSHKKLYEDKTYTRHMQLQLFDRNGDPVENTEFWIKLKVHKKGRTVNLSVETINFDIGQQSSNDPFSLPSPGPGFVQAVDGFLPKNLSPKEIVSKKVASNSGQSLPYSFLDVPPYPIPPYGYTVTITPSGSMIIQAYDLTNPLIEPGAQVMMPTDIRYRT